MTVADALIARAEAMIPVLQEREAAALAARQVSAETIADFHEAGFFKVLQPKRWGGLELGPQVFSDLQIAIARGCPSSAWVHGVIAVHNWQLAVFAEEAQQEVWADDPTTLISSSYMPVGKVEPVDGGYRLSGRWGFSSGSEHCRWVFVGAFVPTPEGSPPDMRTFLVPRSDYTIEDVWHTTGLIATGSNDIVIDDVFVPEHRTHRFADGFRCESPGNATNPGPLYKLPFGQIFVRSVSTPAIGMAQGALDAFVEFNRGRVSRATGAKVKLNARAQLAATQAQATIDACKLVMARNFAEMEACVARGELIPLSDRVRYRYDTSNAVLQCTAAVDALHAASGGAAIFKNNRINRFFQDIHACRAHYANNPDGPGLNLGAVMFGARNTDYFL